MTMPAALTSSEFSDLLQGRVVDATKSVAVAVSGGADSMALALLLGEWCQSNAIALTALTVDHGLRPEAAEEARQVGQWLKEYDIPHVILDWQGDKPQSNIQDQARIARYQLMGEWCQSHHVRQLFLGHHQGDQAETFLIRLFRGSGVDGLSAMKTQSPYPVALRGGADVTICRPLLGLSKGRLLASLRDRGQDWIEDPSNVNDSFTRIKIRNLLRAREIEGLTPDRMAKTAARMGRVQSLLQDLTEELTEQTVTFNGMGYAHVTLLPLMAAHEEIALRCLASVLRRIGGGTYVPRLSRLEALYDKMKRADFSGQTLSGCLIIPLATKAEGRYILVSREPAAIDDIIDSDGGVYLWDGRFEIDCLGHVGQLRKLELAAWQAACRASPDLKAWPLQEALRYSLPCMTLVNGAVILPNFVPGFETRGFQATFLRPCPKMISQ